MESLFITFNCCIFFIIHHYYGQHCHFIFHIFILIFHFLLFSMLKSMLILINLFFQNLQLAFQIHSNYQSYDHHFIMCFTINYLLVWKFDFNHFKNSDYTIPFKNYFIVKECFDLVKLNLLSLIKFSYLLLENIKYFY